MPKMITKIVETVTSWRVAQVTLRPSERTSSKNLNGPPLRRGSLSGSVWSIDIAVSIFP
jgi:hypothetical protein